MISIQMTTACRYADGLLPKAVESILTQSYQDFELIVCDDASEDGTSRYLEEVRRQDPRVKVIRSAKNVHSVAVSLGRCMEHSSHERPYLTWMFDDNVLCPGALRALIEAIDQTPQLDFAFGKTVCHLPDGSTRWVGDQPAELIRANVEQSSVLVPNAGLIAKKSLFKRAGWYDASVILRRSTDWDLFRRMAAVGRFDTIAFAMAEEYGELQETSLRNTYRTSFEIMKRYCDLRDAACWPVTLEAALYHPMDRIPPGDWSEQELRDLSFMMLEYYLSICDLHKTLEWAERLARKSQGLPWWHTRLRHYEGEGSRVFPGAAVGAWSALVFGHSRCEELRRDLEQTRTQLEAARSQAAAGERHSARLEARLRATRYEIVDKINGLIRKIPPLHRSLKQAAEYSRRALRTIRQ